MSRPRYPGPHVWRRAQRSDALVRQGGRCIWCLRGLSHRAATSEHLQPKSLGGTDKDNIAAAHYACNRARGSIPEKQFKRMLNGGLPYPDSDIHLIIALRSIVKRTDLAVRRIHRLVGIAA